MANIKDEQFMIYNVDYEYRKYLYNYDNRVNLKANRRYTGIELTHSGECGLFFLI